MTLPWLQLNNHPDLYFTLSWSLHDLYSINFPWTWFLLDSHQTKSTWSYKSWNGRDWLNLGPSLMAQLHMVRIVSQSSALVYGQADIEMIWIIDRKGIALIGKRLSRGRVQIELVGYLFFIWTKLELYAIATRPIPDHFPIAWLLDPNVKNVRVGNRSDTDQSRSPRPLMPSEPD